MTCAFCRTRFCEGEALFCLCPDCAARWRAFRRCARSIPGSSPLCAGRCSVAERPLCAKVSRDGGRA